MARKSKIDAELEKLFNDGGMGAMDVEELIELAKPRMNALIELGSDTTIDLSTIVRVDRDRKFVYSQLGNSRFQFGIIINKSVDNRDIPNSDIEVWYDREDIRDAQYNTLMERLKENGRQIVTMKRQQSQDEQ